MDVSPLVPPSRCTRTAGEESSTSLPTSDFVRRDPDGNVLADTRESHSRPVAGTAVWGAPLTPHSLENVGSEEFHTLTVELKDAFGTNPI